MYIVIILISPEESLSPVPYLFQLNVVFYDYNTYTPMYGIIDQSGLQTIHISIVRFPNFRMWNKVLIIPHHLVIRTMV